MTNISQRCLLCGSEKANQIAVVPPGYKVWTCLSCRFNWIDRHDLHEIKAPTLYQDYPYNQMIHTTFELMRDEYRSGMLSRLRRYYPVDRMRELTFLDVGCANGEYLATALDLGLASVAGVEIDQSAARNARQYGTIVEDVNALQSCFDIVQIKNVLTNIPDFSEFLESCLTRLKPDGILFFDVLNHASLTSVIRKIRNVLGSKAQRYGTLRPPHVINGFSQRNAIDLLQEHDLQLLHVSQGYLGSNQVPYGNARAVKLVGQVSHALGMGTMIMLDARKASSL